MFRFVIALFAIFGLLAPVNAVPQSQEHQYHEKDSKHPRQKNSDRNVVARLAYRTTYWTQGQGLRQACFALYRDGYYQLLRTAQNSTSESLQGYLDQNQMIPLAGMLKNLEFDANRGGAVFQDSEVLVADIARDDQIARRAWLDPDHRRPLPESAVKIVSWLQSFKPQDASPFRPLELADQSVCPAGRWEQLPDRM